MTVCQSTHLPSVWQHIELNVGMAINLVLLVLSVLALSEISFLPLNIKDQIMLYIGTGFLIALYQLLKPIYQNPEKGEPNQVIGWYGLTCLIWTLFGIAYNEKIIIWLQFITICATTITLVCVRGKLSGYMWGIPFFALVILTWYFQKDIQDLSLTHKEYFMNYQTGIEIIAASIELSPFLQKLRFQIRKKQFHPESIQGLAEMLPLYFGCLLWHLETHTYYAASITCCAIVVISLNIYLDAHRMSWIKHIQEHPILRYIRCDRRLIITSALVFTAQLCLAANIEILEIKAESLSVIPLSVASIIALSSFLAVIRKNPNEGEPNQNIGLYAISICVWFIYSFVFDKPWLMPLNFILMGMFLYIFWIRRDEKSAIHWGGTLILIMVTLFVCKDILYIWGQESATFAVTVQICAASFRVVPFANKLISQLKGKNINPESIQGFFTTTLLFTGWFVWHIVTETYFSAAVTAIAIFIILINMYFDATRAKTYAN